MLKITCSILLAVGALFLSGCDWYAKGGHNDQQGTWGEIGVSGTIKANFYRGLSSAQSVDYDQIAMVFETSGTQVVDGSGTATVNLKNSSNALLASRNFTYIVSNGVAVPANAYQIESWANQYPSASKVTMRLNNIPTTDNPNADTARLTIISVYQGEPTASATTSWPAGGGRICDWCPPKHQN